MHFEVKSTEALAYHLCLIFCMPNFENVLSVVKQMSKLHCISDIPLPLFDIYDCFLVVLQSKEALYAACLVSCFHGDILELYEHLFVHAESTKFFSAINIT